MVCYHLLRKGFRRIITALDCRLAGGDFEHVAGRGFLHEILGLWGDAH
jgi:hypothetical protein